MKRNWIIKKEILKSEEKLNYKERNIEKWRENWIIKKEILKKEEKMNYKERNIEKWREIEL